MSTMRAKAILERRGFSGEAFLALHKLATSHADKRGGQHTNGGCRNGRCDYGSPTCAAWHGIGEAIVEMDRELEGARAQNAELVEALREVLDFVPPPSSWPQCAYPECAACQARNAHDKASALLSRVDARIAVEKP